MSCLKEKAMVGRIGIGGTLIGALIAGPSDWLLLLWVGLLVLDRDLFMAYSHALLITTRTHIHRGHLHRAIGHHLATILITLTIRGVVTPWPSSSIRG